MTVCFITNGLQRTAGTERVIVQLARELNGNVVIYVPGSTEIAFEGYENLSVISLKIGDFPSKGILAKLCHRLRYFLALKKENLTQAYLFSFSLDLNLVNILLSFFKKTQVIACEHIEYGYHKGARHWLRKLAYRKKGVQVVCLTETDKKKYQKDGINALCIPNFIYPNHRFCHHENKNILAIGRLEYQKNFSLLINAFSKSNLPSKGWALTIVGEGSEYSALNTLIHQLGMEQCIQLKTFTKKILSFYEQASVFCMSSRFEAFPMVLLEAMNHGLPVLVTNFPTGAKEILGEDNQQIAKYLDEEDLISKMNTLCNDKALRESLSYRNRQTIQHYFPEHIMSRWEALIR